jgi:hypothetical protein
LKISILQGTISGTAVYVEDHSTSTNSNGLVSLSIGGGNVISGTFSAINWEIGPYFVKMEADPTGGTNYTVSGTSQLLSVPYALHAKTADSIVGGGATGGFTHYIGEQFGGGVIFHLWKDAQGAEHGLIVALTNQSTAQSWSNVSSTLIGVSAQSSGIGLSNSNAIVGQAGHTSSAAKLCLDLVSNGQSDWYLPSIDELSKLHQNKLDVNTSLRTLTISYDLLNNNTFWSSTEFNANDAYRFLFSSGQFGTGAGKNFTVFVRAIRSF